MTETAYPSLVAVWAS